MTIKELKKGDYFTIKPYAYPSEGQVYIRGEYVREMKAYSCYKFNDVNHERFIKGTREVFVDFTF